MTLYLTDPDEAVVDWVGDLRITFAGPFIQLLDRNTPNQEHHIYLGDPDARHLEHRGAPDSLYVTVSLGQRGYKTLLVDLARRTVAPSAPLVGPNAPWDKEGDGLLPQLDAQGGRVLYSTDHRWTLHWNPERGLGGEPLSAANLRSTPVILTEDKTGKALSSWPALGFIPTSLASSPSGREFLLSDGAVRELWRLGAALPDLRLGRERSALREVVAMALSPSRDHAYVVSEDWLYRADLATLELSRTRQIPGLRRVMLDESGHALLVQGDRSISVIRFLDRQGEAAVDQFQASCEGSCGAAALASWGGKVWVAYHETAQNRLQVVELGDFRKQVPARRWTSTAYMRRYLGGLTSLAFLPSSLGGDSLELLFESGSLDGVSRMSVWSIDHSGALTLRPATKADLSEVLLATERAAIPGRGEVVSIERACSHKNTPDLATRQRILDQILQGKADGLVGFGADCRHAFVTQGGLLPGAVILWDLTLGQPLAALRLHVEGARASLIVRAAKLVVAPNRPLSAEEDGALEFVNPSVRRYLNCRRGSQMVPLSLCEQAVGKRRLFARWFR